MGLFDGKVAIITGAGGGIGRCHALAFAAEGAKVVVNDVGGARDGTGEGASMADRVVEEIRSAGGEAAANYDSVCSDEGAQNLIKTAVDSFGGVDIVVNNAGILRDKTMMKLTLDNWEAVMAVHATGTFLVSKYAAIQMKEQGRGGKIVNTSSYAGLKGNFGQSNYACAKAGIYGLTVVCALELAKHDIQVNVIAPMAKTRMTEDISMVPEDMLPEQISPMVLFLASKHADAITGTVYGIHGQQIFEYKMQMNDGVTKDGSEHWTPAEIADKIELIRQWQKPAPAAAVAREITAKDKCDAIFDFLPEFFVPEKAAGWTATVHFKVAGAADYTLSVADGTCKTAAGLEGTPTCVVSTDADTFTGMAEQKVNAAKAFMEGKIKATNLNDMMRFQPAFPFKADKVAQVMAQLKERFAAAAPAAGAPAREITPKDKCDAIFKHLPDFFAAEKAAGWTATVHFKVAGAADYTLTIADGKCSTRASLEGTPTCVVTTDAETFTGMAEQKVNPAKAFMEGKIKATNLNDMMRFQPAFPFKPEKVAKVMEALQAEFGGGGGAAAAAPAREITPKDKCAAIFKFLPEFFVAEKAAGWTATVQFKIAGGGDYTLSVADGKCSTAAGLEGTPTCVVTTDADTFTGMAEQKVNAAKAFMEGKIKATNLNDMMRFQPAFPFKPEKVAEVMAQLKAEFGGGAAPAAAAAPSKPKPTGLNFDMVGHSVSGGYALVGEEATRAYAAATNDENPYYTDGEREGGVIAPPLFPVKLLADGLFKLITDDNLRADMLRLVHGEQDMIFHEVIKPGDLVSMRGDIEEIIEKSSGNLVNCLGKVYRDGRLLCEARSGLFIRGKKKGEKSAAKEEAAEAEREELFSETQVVDKDQSYRYAEASGDTNPIHVDEAVAKSAGLPGIILHGLCTMAFTCRAVVKNACGDDPTRLRRLKVRFAKPVLPGDTLTTKAWQIEENDGVLAIGFETRNQDDVVVISNGLAEVRAA